LDKLREAPVLRRPRALTRRDVIHRLEVAVFCVVFAPRANAFGAGFSSDFGQQLANQQGQQRESSTLS
jgi:ferric-dicitrate binding protein FerR (iron transport regulator)